MTKNRKNDRENLPKKHCLITQNRFWPFFGIFSGFLGVPRTIYFSGLSLYLDYFFARKRLEVERPLQRVLVGTKINVDNTYTLQILKFVMSF